MRIRRHLSYANVVATVALLLAAGTGGAYAINSIGSRDIKDDSVRSKDLRDGHGVKAADVRRNALGGRQIDEGSLVGEDIVAMHGDQDGTCSLTDSVYSDCATVQVDLVRRSSLLVVVTGGFASVASADSNAACEVRIDDENEPLTETPGESAANTDSTATDGFARTLVSTSVAAGPHDVALACSQLGPEEAEIRAPTIAVIAVTSRP